MASASRPITPGSPATAVPFVASSPSVATDEKEFKRKTDEAGKGKEAKQAKPGKTSKVKAGKPEEKEPEVPADELVSAVLTVSFTARCVELPTAFLPSIASVAAATAQQRLGTPVGKDANKRGGKSPSPVRAQPASKEKETEKARETKETKSKKETESKDSQDSKEKQMAGKKAAARAPAESKEKPTDERIVKAADKDSTDESADSKTIGPVTAFDSQISFVLPGVEDEQMVRFCFVWFWFQRNIRHLLSVRADVSDELLGQT